MSTEHNNTSDWTLEDCRSYINILYANRASSFKERKANAFFNSQTKKNRKTSITNDGIYVDGRLSCRLPILKNVFLSEAFISSKEKTVS